MYPHEEDGFGKENGIFTTGFAGFRLSNEFQWLV